MDGFSVTRSCNPMSSAKRATARTPTSMPSATVAALTECASASRAVTQPRYLSSKFAGRHDWRPT